MFVFLVKAMNKPLSEIKNNHVLFVCKFNLEVKRFLGGPTDNQINGIVLFKCHMPVLIEWNRD